MADQLRAAAQAVLDRWDSPKWEWAKQGPTADLMADLRAALAQQAEPVAESCIWQQDGDSDSGVYGTSCGRYFSLDDGTPEDNRLAWCCYCGKRLVQELITEDDDE